MPRPSVVLPILLLFAVCLASHAGTTEPTREDGTAALRESVRVERAVLTVFVEPGPLAGRERGACSNLSASDLLVTVDGEPVEITAVDHARIDTLHSVLIDTSGSMARHFAKAKEAAVRYLDGLPRGDRALVASFAESLILASPPTTDRERLKRAVLELETGDYTALWDALHYLLLYLESLPGHKVVIVITDGVDSRSLRRHSVDEVLDTASGIPDLSVFPVGLGVPVGRTGMPRPTVSLGLLASATSGRLIEVEGSGGVGEAFRRIRERLDARFDVFFVPRSRVAGEEDAPRGRVKVRARRGVPCRVVSIRRGEPGRTPSPPARAQGPPPAPLDELLDGAARCLAESVAWRARARMSVPIAPPLRDDGDEAVLYPLDPPVALGGRTVDIALERGTLYDARPLAAAGRFRAVSDRKPRFVSRALLVDVPPLDVVRAKLRSPADAVMHLLERSACAVTVEGDPPFARDARWIHGQTFIELRGLLGEALFGHFPEYRDWAIGRREEARAAAVEALRRSSGVADDRLTALAERIRSPLSPRGADYLVEWLGDVVARDVAAEIERRAADALLEAPRPVGSMPDRATSVIEGWERLRRWLPLPTEVRVLTPLVPAFDPERRVVGFYRVVLPRPRTGGPPGDPVPEAPHALSFLRWLLGREEIRGRLEGRLEVRAVESRPTPRRQRRLLAKRLGDRPAKERLVTVSLTLGGRSGEEGSIGMTAQVVASGGVPGGGAETPVCVDVSAGSDVPPELASIARLLSGFVERSGLPCPGGDGP